MRKGRGGAAGVRRENGGSPADQKPGADPVPPHGGMRPEQKQALPDNKTFRTNFCLAGRFFRKAGAVAFSWNGKLLQSEDTGSGYVSKSRGNHIKSGGFCKAEHQIHVLHRLSCSAFYHIVKHRYYLQHPSVVNGIYLHITII